MPPLVAHGQTDERTPGEWIWMRAPLTGEVGEEEQALGASRDARRLVDQRSELDAGRQRVAEPAEAAAASMTDMCQRPGTAWQNA